MPIKQVNIDAIPLKRYIPVRTVKGAYAIRNSVYDDLTIKTIIDHTCKAETLQAVGRIRAIYANEPKDVYILSVESFEDDLLITEFISRDDLLNDGSLDDGVSKVIEDGFVDKRNLKNYFKANDVKNHKDKIEKALFDFGLERVDYRLQPKKGNAANKTFYVDDEETLNQFIKNNYKCINEDYILS